MLSRAPRAPRALPPFREARRARSRPLQRRPLHPRSTAASLTERRGPTRLALPSGAEGIRVGAQGDQGDQGDRRGTQVPEPAIFPHAQCACLCTCALPSLELSRAHASSPAADTRVFRRMDPRRGWRGSGSGVGWGKKRGGAGIPGDQSERSLVRTSDRRTAGSECPGTMTVRLPSRIYGCLAHAHKQAFLEGPEGAP